VVEADVPFSAQNWLAYLLRMLDAALGEARGRIAHVKAQVQAGETACKASITQSGGPVSFDVQEGNSGAGQVRRLEFVLNARVETAPDVLEGVVRAVMAELSPPPAFRYTFTELACFSPAPPRPTERMMA
jgi:hypothetical protein